jgi:prepilin-type processing-associated H-X9-DG protein
MGRGWRSYLEPHLSTKINKDNPSVLFCPEDPTDKDKFEATSYAYSMAFYHSPEHIDTMISPADTYGPNSLPSVPQQCSDVAKPSGKILIGEWSSNHSHINGSDEGWWGWQGRRNYLFADGHVRFLRATDIRPARDGRPDANLTIRGIKGIDWPR